jgi:hypothetical protein
VKRMTDEKFARTVGSVCAAAIDVPGSVAHDLVDEARRARESEARLLRCVEELADKDDGIACRVSGAIADTPERDCDCWSCDWTRRARAAIAEAES